MVRLLIKLIFRFRRRIRTAVECIIYTNTTVERLKSEFELIISEDSDVNDHGGGVESTGRARLPAARVQKSKQSLKTMCDERTRGNGGVGTRREE